MYDFNKAGLSGLSVTEINNNPYLEFIGKHNTKTGEVLERIKTSKYLGLKNFFEIVADTYINLGFSFHYYFNEGKHNHNDFKIIDFVNVLIDLNEKFAINPLNAILHNLEVGVNIKLPFQVKTLLDSIISYKGKEYKKENYSGGGYSLTFVFQYYTLKIYDKGSQFNQADNILRFEIRSLKMACFKAKKIQIRSYFDLLEHPIINQLSALLLRAFEDLLIYDQTINIDSITEQSERELLINGRNPKYWTKEHDRNRNTFKSNRSKFRALVLKNGKCDIQAQVLDLMKEKLKVITEISPETEKIINGFKAKFHSKTIPELPTLSNSNDTRINLHTDSLFTPELPTVYEPSKKNPNTQINPLSIGLKQVCNLFDKKPPPREGYLVNRSFVGITGKFYVQTGSCYETPVNEIRYAVYDSVEAYNKRLHLPEYADREQAVLDFMEWLPIDLNSLTAFVKNN